MERLTERVFAFNGTSCMQIKACGNDMCDETCRNRTGKEGCKGCPIRIAIDKLAQYEELEEQNKLLKLPCAVGSLVYEPYPFMGDGAWEIDAHKVRLEDLEKIGKTVFLTQEEAEAAIRTCQGRG